MHHCHIAASPPVFILRSSVLFWLLILLHDLPPSPLLPPMKVFSVCGAEKFHTDVPLHGRSFSHSLYFGPQTLSRCLYSGSSYHLVLGNFVTHFSLIHFLIFLFFLKLLGVGCLILLLPLWFIYLFSLVVCRFDIFFHIMLKILFSPFGPVSRERNPET